MANILCLFVDLWIPLFRSLIFITYSGSAVTFYVIPSLLSLDITKQCFP